MKAKHTPGPWIACEYGDYGDYDGNCTVVLGEGGDIRTAIVLGFDTPENQANARLIAAAPDMLEVLQNCLDCDLGPGNDWVKYKIRAAIAKADGRLQDSQKLTELAYEAYCDEALK